MNMLQNPESLGFDGWFKEQAKNHHLDRRQLARVIAVDREQYLLLNETGAFRARLSGKFRHESSSPEELPCVGDWLYVEKNVDVGDEFGLIRAVLKRKTFLRRKAAGQSSGYQMIAANVDVVFVVQSCHFDFNLNRLERYLVMVAEGDANPIVLLTKTDLVSPDELVEKIDLIRKAGITGPVQTLSNITRQGIDELNQLLSPGKTYCFVGSSGVGKSTVINGLIGEKKLATKNVSATGEGTHTTVRRELIVLDSGVMVIDNPGMREFGILASEEAMEASFSDIHQLAQECRFRDCTHTDEPDCAVLKALNEGHINIEHLENFKKLSAESKYNQMSYFEKRKKDRAFGKLVKNVKKDFYRNRGE